MTGAGRENWHVQTSRGVGSSLARPKRMRKLGEEADIGDGGGSAEGITGSRQCV